MHEHIISAYTLEPGQANSRLSTDKISEGLKDKSLAWVHLDGTIAKTRPWLEEELSYLDPYVVSALLEEETRPRQMAIGEGVLIILRGINLNPGADAEDMVALRLYIDAQRIISVERRPIMAVRDIANDLESGKGPHTAGDFLSRLVRNLTIRVEGAITGLDDRTDGLEELLLAEADIKLRHDIVDVRKKAIKLRRHLAPQREVIVQIRNTELDWMSEKHKRSLSESYNQATRVVEELDAIRERAQIVKDELASLMSDRLNRNTYILSVIAAIFLPLGFLTGLFGINIGGMPGVESPTAFAMFSIFLTVLVGLQVVIFRRLKWF